MAVLNELKPGLDEKLYEENRTKTTDYSDDTDKLSRRRYAQTVLGRKPLVEIRVPCGILFSCPRRSTSGTS